MPPEEITAADVRVGDVVRLDDPQSHRVDRVLRDGDQVIIESRPIGLEIAKTTRTTLPANRTIDRLGRT